jgi:hypothetical protein
MTHVYITLPSTQRLTIARQHLATTVGRNHFLFRRATKWVVVGVSVWFASMERLLMLLGRSDTLLVETLISGLKAWPPVVTVELLRLLTSPVSGLKTPSKETDVVGECPFACFSLFCSSSLGEDDEGRGLWEEEPMVGLLETVGE